MKKLLLSALALSTLVSAHTLDDIKARGTLKVAIFPYEQPFAYIEAEEYKGFEIELAHELSKALFSNPDKVEFIKVEMGDRSKVLLNKEADVTLAIFTARNYAKKRLISPNLILKPISVFYLRHKSQLKHLKN